MTHLSLLTSDQLKLRFAAVRRQSEFLAAPLAAEDTVVQPVVDVSPPKWHLAHSTWFFEEFVLAPFDPEYQRFHPRYAFLFNSYYEGAGPRVQRVYRGNMTRPTRDEILDYRAFVTVAVEERLQADRLPQEALGLLELGLHHEQQHQELLLYDIKYILGHNPLFPAYRTDLPEPSSLPVELREQWLPIEAGVYEIGFQGQGFHWDNEQGRHRVFIEAVELLDRLVTQGEFLEFVQAGAYQNYRWWLEEGWRWVNEKQVQAPMYWFDLDGEWHQVTLQGLLPLDPLLPMLHVNYYEADAFARWKGLRLPTEQEWEVACQHYQPEKPASANFVEQGLFSTQRRKIRDFQFYGDAWEWTQSAYLPYPGYQAPPGTVGEYNGKFMINQMVLRGGSFATPANHIRLTYRNFFHPHLQWLFSGFRLAKS